MTTATVNHGEVIIQGGNIIISVTYRSNVSADDGGMASVSAWLDNEDVRQGLQEVRPTAVHIFPPVPPTTHISHLRLPATALCDLMNGTFAAGIFQL